MIRTIDASSKPRSTTALAVGLALSAIIALGSFAGSVRAEERDHDRGHEDRGHDRDHGWTGGYYSAPPVIYGAPGYYPPPVVYGPSVGISVPGVSIGIR
jgi:hypothetical protein